MNFSKSDQITAWLLAGFALSIYLEISPPFNLSDFGPRIATVIRNTCSSVNSIDCTGYFQKSHSIAVRARWLHRMGCLECQR